jgi:hypothetical protein
MKHLLTIFVLLLALTCCTTEADRNRMRAALDSINGRNRSGQPFTVKDVQPYVEFFDEHGTPNDRLLAHYLLGLAYYDHGEAPMALQCYQDAADCADTTAADCDYAQLARIYGQMAQVFYDQGLYRQQLDYDNLSVKFAWKGKDTLLAIRNNEQVIYAYRMLGIVDSVIYIFQHVSNLYRKYGYNDFAARTLVSGMRTLINNEEYATVKNYIDIYEKESDYFDFDGNIEHGREIYYNVKGLYYLGIGKLDSARYFFQKEINKGKDFNNQNAGAKGLALLYQKQHLPDSSAKYALYAYSMLDSLYAQRTTKEVERMQAMYDYTRHQKIAQQEKEKASDEKSKRQFTIALLVLIVIVASRIIYTMHEEKRKEQAQYLRNLEELEQTQTEVLQLRAHAEEYEELIAKKERLLEEQRLTLQEQQKKSLQDHAAKEKHIKESAIYQCLQKKQFGQKLTVQELQDCRKLVLETLPEFNNLLISKQYKINMKDFDVCMLFRLGFKSKEVSNMVDITQGRVSQICSKLLHDVFKKDKGGVAELTEILHELY